MISAIIPTLDAEASLAGCLAALVPAFVDGLVREVIVADGGSRDRTLDIADQAGSTIVSTAPGRGGQLRAGAARAKFPWLLFLHADTILEPGWERDVSHFIERAGTGRLPPKAGCFRFTLDDDGFMPRAVEAGVSLRMTLFKLPYGDQGLIIPRTLYDEVGGFADIPIMEDVDLVRRLGRSRLTCLRARAVTSAVRYRRDGYLKRVVRNQLCLTRYLLGVPAARIAGSYEGRQAPTL